MTTKIMKSSEKELRDKCNTTELGTYADSIISCVKQYKCSAQLVALSMVEMSGFNK